MGALDPVKSVVELVEDSTVKLSGSSAEGESDQAGTGNATVTFAATVRFVDVYNGHTGTLEISSGGVTRIVPPGPRLVEFPAAASSFTIVSGGSWVVTPNA